MMKEQRVRLKCRKKDCAKEYLVKKSALEPHQGKAVKINCIHCGDPSVFRIRVKNAAEIPEKDASDLPTRVGVRNVPVAAGVGNKIYLQTLTSELTDEQTVLLNSGKNRIGRISQKPKVEIPILTKDKYMSRNHCCIEILVNPEDEECSVVISDQSRNGTWVNDIRIEPGDEVFIEENDIIKMGKTRFRVLVKKDQ